MPVPSRTASADDAEIIRLLTEQDAGGLRLLLSTHGPAVRGLLARDLGSSLGEQGIDNALNEAAYNAWRSSKIFDPKRGTLRTWFYVIARNAGLGALRVEKNQPRTGDGQLDQLAATEPTVEIPRPLSTALRECIEKLPRIQRRIIEADLASGDIADAGELAEELETSKNSIYVSRSIARKRLRQSLMEAGHSIDVDSGPSQGDEG